MSRPRAGIVVTGTEVLTGRVRDANGPWLADALRVLGLDLVHTTICRDRPEDVRAQLEFHAARGMDLVITTGGLGPTADDLTAQVVCEFMERDTRLDEDLLARIEAIVRPYAEQFGWDWEALAFGARKQATVPVEAEVLDPSGTAPGLVIAPLPGQRRPTVCVLPGPPGELRAMWPAAIASAGIAAVTAGAEVHPERMLRLFGVSEPEIAKTMRIFDESHGLDPLEITTCLRNGEAEVLVSYHPSESARSEAFVAAIHERHGEFVFSPAGEQVDELVATELGGRKLALAESCTGGLIAKRLTDTPGSSQFLAGSVVSYSNEAKVSLLGVSAESLERFGAVSAPVAREMAHGALSRLGAEVALGVTGVAGPGGGTDEKPVGTVHLHACDAAGHDLPLHIVLPGTRGDVRDRAATVGLHLVLRLLRGDHE